MASRVCYHCKQPVEAGEAHDCWTTTETALTRDLPEDLQDAWQRLREEAVALGEQRVYASHSSIMFSRTACYCFVRPKKRFLEVCVFLDRELRVIDTANEVRPWRFAARRGARAVLELAAGEAARRGIRPGMQLALEAAA